MTAYLALVAETLNLALNEGLKPASVVVYLHKESYKEDPGVLDLQGELGFRIFTSYKVVKLWELSPKPILEMESPGLCPFLPLMSGNPEKLLVQSMEKIKKTSEPVASADAKRELIAVLSVLAGKVHQR